MKHDDNDAPTTMPLPADVAPAQMARTIDPWIAGAAIFLVAVGIVLVYSASAFRAQSQAGDASLYLVRHLASVGVGVVCLFVVLRCPIEWWSRMAYPLLIVTIVLLSLLFVPGLGREVNGAVRWLRLGPASFQPGELAKLAIVVYLAHSLAKKRDKVSTFSIGFLPHVLVTSFVVALVIVQPDIGTSAVIYATLGLMLFVAGTRTGYLVLAIVAALPVAYSYVATHKHAAARLLVFLQPEAHKQGIGYQVWESIVSFGSGGAWGLGLGAGKQKLYFLPESHTDFIFAVIGQELGLFGVVLVIVAFGIVVGRGMWMASKLPCRFPMFLAFGVSSWLALQAAVNMAVVMALLPTKGLTLPFVSYGRSSMVMSMIALGVLLRATSEARQTEGVRVPRVFRRRRVRATA